MYGLVDCNNFYCSCHRVSDPTLNNIPIVVLSNNDGCAISRSNEAKELGIPMGAPAYQYDLFFKLNNVQVFSCNLALYGDISNRVMRVLSEFAPQSYIYSIDEIFLLCKGFEKFNLHEYGIQMKNKVFQYTRIPVSVGYAPTKALAKVANKIAKKYPDKTDGVYVIDNEEKRIKALKWLKIEDTWGIGKKYAAKLKAIGVQNAYQFTQLPDYFVQREMTIEGLRLKKELEGKVFFKLGEKKNRKSIATTRSFNKSIDDYEDLKERVSTYASKCAEKLRKEKTFCSEITVFIQTNYFRSDLKQYYKSLKISLDQPSNSSITITKTAIRALEAIFKKDMQYKKAGVCVTGIIPEPFRQFSLFEKENEPEKHQKLMKVIDKMNRSLPNPKVRLASQNYDKRTELKQEKPSKCWTTSWNELLEIE